MASKKPTALITGGAKRIGAALASHLASRGYDLVLHYREAEDEAQALGVQLKKLHGTNVRLRQADLADTDALEHFWDGLPPCGLLVLSAAMYERDTLENMTAATLRRQLAVNLEAPLLLAQGFMAQLPKKVSGNIVMLGDGTLGWSISPQFFSYAVSKHAWASLIDVLAAAVAPRARANLLTLGPTLPTPGEEPEIFGRLAVRAPLQRVGTPAEIATAIDFLTASRGVTGQVISLANGFALATARPSAT